MPALLFRLLLAGNLTLLASCAAGTSNSSAPDAGCVTLDAGGHGDAGTAPDAGNSLCDMDQDGFTRDTPACAIPGLPPDCDDDNPATAPGLVECRDGRLTGCGVHQELASVVDFAEIGATRTQVVATQQSGAEGLLAAVTPRAWGTFSRGLTLRTTYWGAYITILPADFQQPPVEFLDQGQNHALFGVARLPGAMFPVLALAAESGGAWLLDVGNGLSRELASVTFPPGESAIAVAAAGTSSTPTLIVATRTATQSHLLLVDEADTHNVDAPAYTFTPWLVAAGDVVLLGGGNRTLHAASRNSQVVHDLSLDADLQGPGALLALGDAHLAFIPTANGIQVFRFPRCDATTDCAAAGVALGTLGGPLTQDPHLSAAWVRGFSDVIAVGAAVQEVPGTPAHVELAFIREDAPTQVLRRAVALGEGSLDNRALSSVTALSVNSGDDIYGGSFVMVSALVQADGRAEQWTTGLVFCAIQ